MRSSDSSKVQELIHDLGIDTFASDLMRVMCHVFGLGMIGMTWTPNPRDGEFLLNEIMLSGNFGKQDDIQKEQYVPKWNLFWMVNGKALCLSRSDCRMFFLCPICRGLITSVGGKLKVSNSLNIITNVYQIQW